VLGQLVIDRAPGRFRLGPEMHLRERNIATIEHTERNSHYLRVVERLKPKRRSAVCAETSESASGIEFGDTGLCTANPKFGGICHRPGGRRRAREFSAVDAVTVSAGSQLSTDPESRRTTQAGAFKHVSPPPRAAVKRATRSPTLCPVPNNPLQDHMTSRARLPSVAVLCAPRPHCALRTLAQHYSCPFEVLRHEIHALNPCLHRPTSSGVSAWPSALP
jgi:hypothetical protein